jgi:Kef-type K+ transport system membrane component KefB
VGVVFFLFVAGLEVDLTLIVKQAKTTAAMSIAGMAIPFVIGFLSAWFLPQYLGVGHIESENQRIAFSLFFGVALSITALPVIAKTLMDLDLFKTNVGTVVIGAAMFDDLVGWMIFSIILGMSGKAHNDLDLWESLTLTIGFSLFVLIIFRKFMNIVLPKMMTNLSFPGTTITLILAVALFAGSFTEFLGIHAVFGAFMIGIAVGDSQHFTDKIRGIIHQFVTAIFAPLFFVSIGLKVNFISSFDPFLTVYVLLLATLGKFAGILIGGTFTKQLNRREIFAVAFGMNARGAMEIILGLIAFQMGLINESLFVALVIMALVTSIFAGPMIKLILDKK